MKEKKEIFDNYAKFKNYSKLELSKEEVTDLYNSDLKIKEIATKYNCSPEFLNRQYRYHGLKNYDDAIVENENYFSKQNRSREQYYWAGYCAGRTDISSNRSIFLHSKSKNIEHNKKLLNILDCKGIEYGGSIKIESEGLVQDLKRFGLEIGKGALYYEIPEWIFNDEFFNSFLLGLFDSKASIELKNTKNTRNLIGFRIGGSYNLVNSIFSIIVPNYVESNAKFYKLNNSYRFTLQSNKLASFFKWLYKDNNTYLEDNIQAFKNLYLHLTPNKNNCDDLSLMEILDGILQKETFPKAIVRKAGNKKKSTNNSPYRFNCNFFKDINEKTLYWAGFIAARGNFSKNKTLALSLSEQRAEFLHKFKNDIELQNDIALSKNKKGECSYRIHLTSSILIEDLKKFGIDPTSKNHYIPDWLKNHELVHHFLRGCFDIKSSFSVDKRKLVSLSILLNKNFIDDIKDIFYNNLMLTKDIGHLHFRGDKCVLFYGGRFLPLQIMEFLYKGANLYFNNKKEKVENFKKEEYPDFKVPYLTKEKVETLYNSGKGSRFIAREYNCPQEHINRLYKYYELKESSQNAPQMDNTQTQ